MGMIKESERLCEDVFLKPITKYNDLSQLTKGSCWGGGGEWRPVVEPLPSMLGTSGSIPMAKAK